MAVERVAAPTVEEVFRLSARGLRYEIVDGELVEMSPTGWTHGRVVGHAFMRLRTDADRERLGDVVVGEVLFRLDPAERLALAPDVAFVRAERVPPPDQAEGAYAGPPDLALEVQSPGDRPTAMRRKAQRWLDAGTAIVVLLLLRPARAVEVHRAAGVQVFGGDELVDLSPLLPSVPARELFPD